MNNAGLFSEKVVLVTGAASGIGQAIAMAFARENAKLVLADINEEGLEATSLQIREAGVEVISRQTDISVAGEVSSLVDTAVSHFGRLDCAVNNAAIGPTVKPLADFSEAEFDQMMAVNLKGVWLCMKYEIPQMLKNGGGAIVNVASGAGLVAIPNAANYVAAKHGVVGLTRAGAVDYAARNIRINAICPGYTRTPMSLKNIEDTQEFDESAAAAAHPIGRMALPEEQADAVVYLCSDKASFIVGQAIAVDGGYTVW